MGARHRQDGGEGRSRGDHAGHGGQVHLEQVREGQLRQEKVPDAPTTIGRSATISPHILISKPYIPPRFFPTAGTISKKCRSGGISVLGVSCATLSNSRG